MRSTRIEAAAQRYIDRQQFAGIEWHVQQDNDCLSAGKVGFATADQSAVIPDNAIYRIYSMTKPIVSVLALMLIEAGRLRLFDMVAQYNPAFAGMRVLLPDGTLAPALRPITVEDLLTHRAGFTYEFITGCHIAPGYDAINLSEDGSVSLDEMMIKLAAQPLAFQPGSQFRYSVATDVLAHVIEKATGERLSDLLKEHLFEPLDMNDTGFWVPQAEQGRIMPMYGVNDIRNLSPISPPPRQTLTPTVVHQMYPCDDPNFARGGHGLFSTTADYQKFARMLLSGRGPEGQTLLSAATLKMMTSNRIPPEQLPLKIGIGALPGYGWGLGFRVMIDLGQAMSLTNLGEFGWSGAASTFFWVDPEHQMTGVIMTQYLGSILPMGADLRTAAYQALPAS